MDGGPRGQLHLIGRVGGELNYVKQIHPGEPREHGLEASPRRPLLPPLHFPPPTLRMSVQGGSARGRQEQEVQLRRLLQAGVAVCPRPFAAACSCLLSARSFRRIRVRCKSARQKRANLNLFKQAVISHREFSPVPIKFKLVLTGACGLPCAPLSIT
jgi:hypothetical protein